MGIIKKLASHEIQKIAAGEVIERPANVVKELVENSIDAGATVITIRVSNGGHDRIQVIDNGVGMDQDDAQLCCEPHATSKLTSVDQLATVQTHGFRGEALASIASVSTITIITKTAEASAGMRYAYEFGKLLDAQIIAAPTGTDITVAHVFDNVPVRKKFLKKAGTEWRHIVLLFKAYCFAYPHIQFKLYSDDALIHTIAPAETLFERAQALWDDYQHDRLLACSSSQSDITVTGVISDHQVSRYDKQQMFFFVNKRWIKNYQLSQAVLKGYQNVLPPGKFPLVCIMIEVPPAEVDINIHPRKEEVQFLHPKKVEQLITQTVKARLHELHTQRLQRYSASQHALPYHAPQTQQEPDIFAAYRQPVMFEPLQRNDVGVQTYQQSYNDDSVAQIPHTAQSSSIQLDSNMHMYIPQAHSVHDIDTQHFAQPVSEQFDEYRLIGQYALTYLLIEKKDGLFLVDQHAAHERIMYERFTTKLSQAATIQLLFPQIIKLSSAHCNLLMPYIGMLYDFGVTCELFGEDQILISGTPASLQTIAWHDFFVYMVAQIHEHESLSAEQMRTTLHHKLAAQMACKAAVKAGDQLSKEQMEQLLVDVAACNEPLTCPHGRPTGWLMSLNDIEKKFKRKL